jgi:hypothetical protein
VLGESASAQAFVAGDDETLDKYFQRLRRGNTTKARKGRWPQRFLGMTPQDEKINIVAGDCSS